MAIIYTYPRMVTVNNGDLLLISAVNTPRKPTMRIRVEDVKGYMNTCPTITDCVGSTGNLNEVLTADGTGGVIWSPAGGGGAGVLSITTATGVSTGDPISPLAAATGAVTLTSNAYAGTTNVGYVPTGGSATTFLRGDGTWVTPGAGGIPWPYQYDLGLRQLIQGENPGATGDATTAYGVEALTSITSGTRNTAIGTGAGYNITSSNKNTVIGSNAGYSLDGGAFPSSGENVLIGASAAENATNLIGTVAVGYGTLEGITINTSRNTAIGYAALAETTLNENTAVGYLSGFHSDSEYNVFIGSSCAAGDPLTPLSGDRNIFMGYLCGRTTQGASTDNVFIGTYAAENTKVISDSVIIGAGAGKNYTGASTQDHVIIGANAGSGTLTGDNNIIIGYNAQPSTTIVSNEITIGNASHDRFRLPGGLPAFDDDAAAGVGGILTNMLYQTTGAGAAPLNAAGIVMIKQ